MKFTVPSSSSFPQRPQFENRLAISRTSFTVNESLLVPMTVLLREPADADYVMWSARNGETLSRAIRS